MELENIPSLEDITMENGNISFKTPENKKENDEKVELQNEDRNQENELQNASEENGTEGQEKEIKAEKPIKDNNNSSLNELVTSETSTEEPPTETDFEDIFSKRIQEEGYAKREEIEKELSEKPITDNDFISELLKLDKEGVDVSKSFLKEYLTDYDKYNSDNVSDAVELVKRQIMETEGLDELDAKFEIEDKYAALFDEYDKDSPEYERAKRRLSIEAKKYLKSKKEQQSKLSLPDQSKSRLNKEEVINEFIQEAQSKQAEQQETLTKFLTNASDRIARKIEKVNIDIDGESYEYEPSPEVKKQVKDAVRNYTSFLDKNFIKDGKLDEEGLGVFFAEFYGKKEVNKLIRGRSKAEGKEELIEKDLKNATKSPSITSKSSIASDEQLEIGRQLLGKNIF